MELRTCVLFYSTREILPVSNFWQLHAHPPPCAIENDITLAIRGRTQWKTKLVIH